MVNPLITQLIYYFFSHQLILLSLSLLVAWVESTLNQSFVLKVLNIKP